jgi:hypothetical protein
MFDLCLKNFVRNVICSIINERCKQRALEVPAARQHYSRQVAKGFRRKLPSVESVSNQSAL